MVGHSTFLPLLYPESPPESTSGRQICIYGAKKSPASIEASDVCFFPNDQEENCTAL